MRQPLMTTRNSPNEKITSGNATSIINGRTNALRTPKSNATTNTASLGSHRKCGSTVTVTSTANVLINHVLKNFFNIGVIGVTPHPQPMRERNDAAPIK